MNEISTPRVEISTPPLPQGYRYAYHDDDRQPTVWIVDAAGHAVTPVCDDEREAWEWFAGYCTEAAIARLNVASRAVLDELAKYVERLEVYCAKFHK
jgi:hypothetical protein